MNKPNLHLPGFGLFTPKAIVMGAIKDKLKGTGIVKIVLVFDLLTDKYNLMLSNKDGKDLKLDVTEDEITTLKKLFVKRIVSKWNELYDIEPKDVIIEVDIEEENFGVFIQDHKDKVHKFEYK